jgi:hypothetical protein
VLAVRVEDEERAESAAFGSRERPGEEDEALVREAVHERGVIIDAGLRGDPSVDPCWAC